MKAMTEKKLNQLKSLSKQKHKVKRKYIIKDIALEHPEDKKSTCSSRFAGFKETNCHFNTLRIQGLAAKS